MNFDEMDIEPKSESPTRKDSPSDLDLPSKEEIDDDELQSQLLLRTVPLDDGCKGYVFTCSRNGPLAMWRCHTCSFVDSWKNLKKHLVTKWHQDSVSKYHHSRSNFTKVENVLPDISKGQPLPPGMEDEIAGPCLILKSLESYEHPLIGLEYLLELHIIDLKEPRYLCLLCDKRGDPRSILVHLTSQNHYLMYLRKYFRKFFSLIDKLPKSNECKANVSTVTSHLIAKIEEKYGRLQPTATRDDIINAPEQRSIILQKIDNSVHFSESAEDAFLEEMLTVEYVQNPQLLLKNFALKPKKIDIEKPIEDTKSLFNKSTKNPPKKNLRNRDSDVLNRDESPDIVFVGASKNSVSRNGRSRERSRIRSRERSLHRSIDRSARRSRERSLRRSRERSPFRAREISQRLRSRSRHRSRTPDRGRRRYISPPPYRSLRYRSSRSRSPRRIRSRSPIIDRDRFYRRSPSPVSSALRGRERSPLSSRYSSYRYRSPEREIRRIRRSPSPLMRSNDHLSRYHVRSRSRDHSPYYRPHRSRSRSRLRHDPDVDSNSKSSKSDRDHSKIIEKERIELSSSRSYIREAKEVEEKLNKEMDRYAETPESHPAYQDEWKKFWCAKFKEIQSAGKEDPHKYDYKPEWIVFWNIRVKELFDEELKSKIKDLKTKYGFTDDEKSEKPVEKEKKLSPSPSIEDDKKPVIDIKTMWKELTGCEIKDESATAAKRKSLSPWEEDNEDEANERDSARKSAAAKKPGNHVLEAGGAQPISPESLSSISDIESPTRYPFRRSSRSRSFSRSRSRSPPRSLSKDYTFREDYRKQQTKKIHFENPLNIITVLRQLSVLEFQLGSYASHVISLLTSGLTMERIKPQSSIDLLTKDNILFLELVKEKLKGQLLAGVVPKSMVKATLFCIKNIEELLLLVPKLKPSVPPPIPAPPPALLYGAGVDPRVDPIGAAVTPSAGALPYGTHVYSHHYGGGSSSGGGVGGGGYNKMPFKHFDRGGDKFKERYPFRKTSPKRMEEATGRATVDRGRRLSDDYPFKNNEPAAETKPAAAAAAVGPIDEEMPIDKNLIALQIAEVLTQQGRSDVSNEELQALINTVVENLKQEQKMKALQKDAMQSKDVTIPAVMNALSAAAAAVAAATPAAASANVGGSALNVSTIPAGFNLNEVSSSTLALLQDAYVNASVLSANKPFAIEDLTEAELIQMLRNFKNVPRMKQEKLIEYLRKLEVTDPDRVEELKKYVNVL